MSEEPRNIKPGKKRSAAKLIHELSTRKISRAHMSELSQALMSQFDGAEGFAREVYQVYLMAPPPQKVRLMAMMMDLVKNDTLLSGKQTGLDDTSDEDLETELNELLGPLGDGEEAD